MATRVNGRAPALVALAAGVVLLALATPRVVGGILAADGAALAALGRGERVSATRLADAAAARRSALGWHESAETWTALAALELARSRDIRLPETARRAFVDAAITAYRRGLSRGPAQPYAWLQYGQALLARAGAGARIDPVVRLSLDLAPDEPPLVMQRVEIGFLAERLLAPDTRQAIRDQTHRVAAFAPRRLAEFARDRFALMWVREQLADDPATLRRFDAAYFSLPMR
jgi:hypothetical protein